MYTGWYHPLPSYLHKQMNFPRALILLLFLAAFDWTVFAQETYLTDDGVKFKVEVVAKNLTIPWSIAFAEGDLFFTERTGSLQVLKKGVGVPKLLARLDDVRAVGEGGLMGLAFHPSFTRNRFVYLSYTYSVGNNTFNKVVRYMLSGDSLTGLLIIIDRLPGSGVHNGCRIRFGPDAKLYVTTGDAAQRDIAQAMSSFGGKILRLNDDGSIPDDNPFKGSPVYSLGHRNGQGIDWHPTLGLLFESEHGPSGFDGPGGGDEINIIEAGKNYGWPTIHHQQTAEEMVSPLLEFTPAIAPSGASFYSGRQFPSFTNNLFIATLRGSHILRVVLKKSDPRSVSFSERLLEGKYKRIRDIVEGPDGFLYFCTSNRDGRATPSSDDDRILRIVPVN